MQICKCNLFYIHTNYDYAYDYENDYLTDRC